MSQTAIYLELGWIDLAIAGMLVLINGAISVALRLGLARSLAVAVLRMIVQLWLIGLVLTELFALQSPLWTGLAALAMVLFAGREIMARQERPLAGWWRYGLGTGAMLLAAAVVTVFALNTAVRPDPWYAPRYALPLLGMVLGNTMTAIALGLSTLSDRLARERAAVEARLALGATRREAMSTVVQGALRTAMMPIVNAMAATGLVALPGMMTGQILAGAAPTEAVKYQILIMFLIAGSTALGAVSAVLLGGRRLSDRRHRLRLDRLASGGD